MKFCIYFRGAMSSSVKTALKQVRELIQQKNFEKGLEVCENEVLNCQPDNFMGLVFAGKCAYEVGKYAEGKRFFHRATQLEPTNLLGWQGIVQIYEKQSDLSEESTDACKKLLALLPGDDKNRFPLQLKVAKFSLNSGQFDTAFEELKSVREMADDPDNLNSYHNLVFSSCVKLTLKKEFLPVVLTSIAWILDRTDDDEMFQRGCSFWANHLPNDHVFKECQKYEEKFETAPKKMIRLALRLYLATGSLKSAAGDRDEVAMLEDLDGNFEEDSMEETLTGALSSLVKREFMEVIHIKTDSIKGIDKHLIGAIVGEAYLRTRNYWKAESVIRGCLAEIKYPRLKSLLLEEAIVGQDNETTSKASSVRLEKALLIEDLPDGVRLELLQLLLHVYVKSGSVDKAKSLWEQHFRSTCLSGPTVNYLAGQLCICENRLAAAQKCFEDAVKDSAEEMPLARYHLAECLWREGDRSQRIFNELLKCVKADGFFAPAFLLLARFYLEVMPDAETKAAKCLERAFSLNPFSGEIGLLLSDVYKKMGGNEKNVELLQKICDTLPPTKAKWAWLRLGMALMNMDCPEKAVSVLQNLVRHDESDALSLECLADAYRGRGSFESAVKTYEVVVKLLHPDLMEMSLVELKKNSQKFAVVDDPSVYALYQIGQVKLIMKMYDEADSWFQRVLILRPDYIPALVSMGEAYLLAGRHFGHLSRHQRLLDNFNRATAALIRAANLQPTLKCIWKLLGDVCTMIHPLPESLIRCDELLGLMELVQGFMPMEFGIKLDILRLGAVFYTQVITLNQPPAADDYHDLGIDLMHQSILMNRIGLDDSNDFYTETRTNCVNSLKRAVRLNKKKSQFWATLGTAAATDALNLKPLAQHSFIRALELDPLCARHWVNLGVFYLKQGNGVLANQSFKRAEATDPTIPNIWTGQGLIAEQVGHITMLEMLCHSTKLGYEPVGMISYGQHVIDCYINEEKLTEDMRIIVETDIPRATDALTHYTLTHPDDACGWNLLGLLREIDGQHKAAAKAYHSAQECLDVSQKKDLKKIVDDNLQRCQQLLITLSTAKPSGIPDLSEAETVELCRWKHVYPWLKLF